MLGELWSWLIESIRVGNGHMSYRAGRLPWGRYRWELIGGAWLIFCLLAAAVARRARLQQPITGKS